MTVDTLVVFGDSWPAGEELASPATDAFPVLLAEKLNANAINLSQPATSIDHAVLQLLKNVDLLKTPNTVVLFCLTNLARSMYFLNGRPVEIHPQNDDLTNVNYYRYVHSTELSEFNLLRNMLLIQGICKQLNTSVFFVSNWDNVVTHPLLDQTAICPESLFNMIGLQNVGSETDPGFWFQMKGSDYIFPNSAHPNINGHRVITDKLFNWLKEKL